MAVEFKGEEFLYLVHIPDDDEDFRLFNQTDGSTTTDADSIELATKDKTGSDYGDVTTDLDIEGILTDGDDAIKYIKNAQRSKKFVKITEVNTRDLETESGYYMISSFGRTYTHGDYATYSISAALNGSISEGTLTELPDGAPEEGDEGSGGGVEG